MNIEEMRATVAMASEAGASAAVTLLAHPPQGESRLTAPVARLDSDPMATPAPSIASPWVAEAEKGDPSKQLHEDEEECDNYRTSSHMWFATDDVSAHRWTQDL